jgi:hypothetical protein
MMIIIVTPLSLLLERLVSILSYEIVVIIIFSIKRFIHREFF